MSRELLQRAQAYVKRVYTAHADERQKAMGLAYVTAEQDDLAREFARFAAEEINRHRQTSVQYADSTHGYSEQPDR